MKIAWVGMAPSCGSARCRTKPEERLNQVDDIVRAADEGRYAPFVECQARMRNVESDHVAGQR
jgi:hypothetical protein